MVGLLKQVMTLLLWTMGTFHVSVAMAEESSVQTQWLINTLKDSFPVAHGDTLVFEHAVGDVRIKTADTDHIEITAMAQYHKDDPRKPNIQLITPPNSESEKTQRLSVDFSHLEITENNSWSKRRIDVGIIVPKNLPLKVHTQAGLIEAKDIEARTEFKSLSGNITYNGSGDSQATSERGALFYKLYNKAASQSVDLTTLTGDIHIVLLEGTPFKADIQTRGPITSDYSIQINHDAGSPLKHGRIKTKKSGSDFTLNSHSGGVRVQMINAVANK